MLAAEYLRETNISVLYLSTGYLFFKCLEKVFKEKRNEKEIVEVLQQASYRRKRTGK